MDKATEAGFRDSSGELEEERKGDSSSEKLSYGDVKPTRMRQRSNVLENYRAIEFSIGGEDKLSVDYHTPDSDGIVPWMHKLKEDNSTNRIMARRLDKPPKRGEQIEFPARLASPSMLDEADLNQPINDAAGTMSISHNPKYRLLLHTPLDDGPFYCVQMRAVNDEEYRRFCFTGQISYANGDTFAPENIFKDDHFMIRWRWGRMPSFIPVLGFLSAHNEYITSRLEFLHSELLSIEEELIIGATNTTSPNHNPDYGHLTKRLQVFGIAVSNLSRRHHFQRHVIDEMLQALREFADNISLQQIQTAKIDPLLSAIKAREFDLEMLPSREQIAKTTMFNLIVQRDQAMSIQVGRANLEMAQNSAAIAEATMRESSAMSTIAIMTMIFLPATAIASIFGMSMITAGANGAINISPYIWVYFVVSAVFTLLVIGIWWAWSKTREKTLRARVTSSTLVDV